MLILKKFKGFFQKEDRASAFIGGVIGVLSGILFVLWYVFYGM